MLTYQLLSLTWRFLPSIKDVSVSCNTMTHCNLTHGPVVGVSTDSGHTALSFNASWALRNDVFTSPGRNISTLVYVSFIERSN